MWCAEDRRRRRMRSPKASKGLVSQYRWPRTATTVHCSSCTARVVPSLFLSTAIRWLRMARQDHPSDPALSPNVSSAALTMVGMNERTEPIHLNQHPLERI